MVLTRNLRALSSVIAFLFFGCAQSIQRPEDGDADIATDSTVVNDSDTDADVDVDDEAHIEVDADEEREPTEGMVRVPSGSFRMGCNHANWDCSRAIDSVPLHDVFLDTYEIDLTEVSVAQYRQCVSDGVCEPPIQLEHYPSTKGCTYWSDEDLEDHPVSCVTWDQAATYCEWAGRRLCTEAEWEKAARGTDGRTFPWGEEPQSCNYAVIWETEGLGEGCGTGGTMPVGSIPDGASPYGALNIFGNVMEWVADWYQEDYYVSSPTHNPQGPSSGSERVARGSAFGLPPVLDFTVSRRVALPPSTENSETYLLGIRCCRSW